MQALIGNDYQLIGSAYHYLRFYAESYSTYTEKGLSYMDPILKKSSNPSRALVFGLLVSCLFTANAESCSDCPLRELRANLSIDKKHEYVMKLSDVEIERIMAQYDTCFEKRLSDINRWWFNRVIPGATF